MFVVSLFGTLTVIKSNIEGKTPKEVFNGNSIENIKKEIENVMIDLTKELNNPNFLKERKKMSKIKNFFTWLWGNKCTLISLTISILAVGFCNYLMFMGYLDQYQVFVENETLIKILGVALSVGYLSVDIFTTVSKYGCESLEQLDTRYREEAEKKLNALTPEQKAAVKSAIKKFQSQLELIEPKYNEAIKTIESFQTLSKIQGFDASALADSYNSALQFKNTNETLVTELRNQIEVLASKLK